jgi:phosphoenolpyruvate synthase/pyruvate phosphate dikinase
LLRFCQLPNAGVGLARLEFIINNNIGVHLEATWDYPNVDGDLKKAVESVTRGHASPRALYQRSPTSWKSLCEAPESGAYATFHCAFLRDLDY